MKLYSIKQQSQKEKNLNILRNENSYNGGRICVLTHFNFTTKEAFDSFEGPKKLSAPVENLLFV
jgi:hypothetical protein